MNKSPVFFAALLAFVLGCSALVPTASAAGGVIRGQSTDSVYYYDSGHRFVFPNQGTFLSWYGDFSAVTTVTDAELQSIPLAGNVTYRPGARLVKVTTDPKTYAVDRGGVLRWVASEDAARELYGDGWNRMVDDVPDIFFVNYLVGSPIFSRADYDPSAVLESVGDISADKAQAVAAAPAASPAVTAQEEVSGTEAVGAAATVAGATEDPAAEPEVSKTAVTFSGYRNQLTCSPATADPCRSASGGKVKVTFSRDDKEKISVSALHFRARLTTSTGQDVDDGFSLYVSETGGFRATRADGNGAYTVVIPFPDDPANHDLEKLEGIRYFSKELSVGVSGEVRRGWRLELTLESVDFGSGPSATAGGGPAVLDISNIVI